MKMEAAAVIVYKQAEDNSQVMEEYMVIGRFRDYAVVKDEIDGIFCMKDENKILSEGDLCSGKLLISMEGFSAADREAVYNLIKIMEGGNGQSS